jgi:hypothetical protein
MKTLRNARDKAEILRRLGSISPTTQRLWGKMSAHNMVCHLSDGFRLYMGDRPAAQAPVRFPRPIVKWVALWAPLPWPHGFQTFPELDQEGGGTRPAEFASDVAELRHLIESFVGPPTRCSAPPHPHFGHLRESEWLRLGYLHTDHHLRQFGA